MYCTNALTSFEQSIFCCRAVDFFQKVSTIRVLSYCNSSSLPPLFWVCLPLMGGKGMGLRKIGHNVTVVERDLSVDDKKKFNCLFNKNEIGSRI